MSVFDLFRGFFGFPGSNFHGDRRRDPFFEGMTRSEDDDGDDDEEEEEDDGGFDRFFSGGGPGAGRRDNPDGMRFHDRLGIEELLRGVDDLFRGAWGSELPSRHREHPSIGPPDSEAHSQGGASLRDSMLKHPDSTPAPGGGTPAPRTPPGDDSPLQKYEDRWRGFDPRHEADSMKEDKDLDSQVSSEGLDTILKPKMKSFFKSVSVMKIVGPDGTVEERRTVRDSQGKEETTVTRTRADQRDGEREGASAQFTDMLPDSCLQDDFSVFSKIFRGFFTGR
ncbi:HCLS1-associated protein X-1 isoform X1 [Acipenser ruthenus]|uniref:HCLS1-associated protein X-1 isoform X1 n=2 Tax=Acipenser ruthenus TaxID=7906 RepID=UPI002741A2F5|nr:HCLS1-associated protein X-1 isoform X1 [Acipenser ruthenus]XP_033850439.3 HCLS1-associated protein X-1 isoform X1 [Acipenser ruthenus]